MICRLLQHDIGAPQLILTSENDAEADLLATLDGLTATAELATMFKFRNCTVVVLGFEDAEYEAAVTIHYTNEMEDDHNGDA